MPSGKMLLILSLTRPAVNSVLGKGILFKIRERKKGAGGRNKRKEQCSQKRKFW